MATVTKAELAAQLRKSNSALERERSKRRRLDAQLKESRDQQAATAEILKVISGSPADTQPVFDAIVKSALHLFDGHGVAVVLLEGDLLQAAAAGGDLFSFEAARKRFPMPLTRESASGRSILDRCVVHVADTEAPGAPEYARANGRALGYRAMAVAPMMREGNATGAIGAMRKDPGAFSDRQLNLLQTFADQALIAIENVRLFNETKEALERQRATADVLASISGSMTDTQPVFDAIVRNLRRLFGTRFAVLQLLHDGIVEMPAIDGDPGFEKLRERYPRPLDETTVGGRAMLSKQAFQLVPVLGNPDAPVAAEQFAREFGFNSVIFSPMIHDGTVIGAIGAAHPDARPFDDRQIALIKTFADQAVIAIENARLFNETREALEQQRASAEVLNVISNSVSDAQPVFEKIVESCERIFATSRVGLNLIGPDGLVHAGAYGKFPGAEKLRRENFPHPVTGSATGAVISTGRPVQYPDALGDPDVPQYARRGAETVGFRAFIMAPLLSERGGLGAIFVGRETAGSFSEKESALLKTFADQAVIAIENARLFNETKEALAHQTAAADVLRVISNSVADAQPVFEQILDCCESLMPNDEIFIDALGEDGMLHWRAGRGADPERVRGAYPVAPPELTPAYLARGVASYADFMHGKDVPQRIRDAANAYGRNGSLIEAAMLSQGRLIGTITAARLDLRGYTPKEERLLKTFADQAVIAIENVRLFRELESRNTELSEALEQQTATAEVLRAISQSPADLRPILETLVRAASRFCGAPDVVLTRLDGEVLRGGAAVGSFVDVLVEQSGSIEAVAIPVNRGSVTGRAVVDRCIVHVTDLAAEPESEFPVGRELQRRYGHHTMVSVPLLREGVPLGALALIRREVRPFSEKQLALLKTFADQAVIAIENVRLFNETKEALERQTATAAVLRVISASPNDVGPVFAEILDHATQLCEAQLGFVFTTDGSAFEPVAQRGLDAEPYAAWRAAFRVNRVATPMSGLGRVLATRAPVHIADVADDEAYRTRDPLRVLTVEGLGARTFLAVPLLKDGAVIGAVVIYRREVRPFSDKQMFLLQTFADQAVIAIENVRLFNETKEALERQTATAEILKVISSSPTDVQPVFDAIVNSVARLFGRKAALRTVETEGLRRRARSYDPAPGEYHGREVEALDHTSIVGRAVLEGRTLQWEDTLVEGAAVYGLEHARQLAFRSIASAPLMLKGRAIGVISVSSPNPGTLSEKQMELLTTFADQAVIAIENVRLFNETKEALERQTATGEILKVISASPTDVQPVFDAIANSALRLFSGQGVGILLADGDRIHLGAACGSIDLETARKRYPLQLDRGTLSGRAILDRSFADIADTEAPETPELLGLLARELGYRAAASAPMMKEGNAIGAITVVRKAPGALAEKEVALLKTFADQAVIAIENVRLFKELQSRTEALTRSVGQLTALGEVGQAISSTLDLDEVLKAIVSRAVQLSGLDAGVIYEYDQRNDAFLLRASESFDAAGVAEFRGATIRRGEGAVGRSVETREPAQVPDTHAPDYPAHLRDLLERNGFRALLAVPLVREEQVIGALMVIRRSPGAFAAETVELLKTFAGQSALAIQNARLFREIAEKGRQLEEASRHKSQFLASMSHELRTPLNAILGFNEMILAGIYGAVPADMKEPLEDIQTSGKHLLRLINNVLDLAKIEAGRMELALADYSVHDTVESVRSTLRPLAAEKGLEFAVTVPEDLPLAHGDSGRITQCLVNLAGNSLKFTKAGKVEITVEHLDDVLRFSVRDTGIGIPPDKIGSLFTEFKQTDATIASEYGGSGLGLSIVKKFVEMHGGRIWVESEPGKGSTFGFEIPLRAGEKATSL